MLISIITALFMALGQCAPEAINNNVEPGIADTTTYIQLLQD